MRQHYYCLPRDDSQALKEPSYEHVGHGGFSHGNNMHSACDRAIGIATEKSKAIINKLQRKIAHGDLAGRLGRDESASPCEDPSSKN